MLQLQSIFKGRKKILQNLGWLSLDKVLRMSVGLLVAVLVARHLGPKDFGLLSYALSAVAIIGVIADLGLNQITTREIVRERIHSQQIVTTTFSLKLIGSALAIGLICCVIVISKPDDAATRTLLILLSTTLLFKTTDAIKSWFEAEIESRYTVWAENTAFLVCGMIKVSLVFADWELIYFAYTILLESAMGGIGLILLYYLKGQRLCFTGVNLHGMMSLLKESWPLLLSNVALIIYMRIDLIMLDAFSGAHEVGLYSAATRISESLYFIPMIICSTLAPSVIRAHAGDSSRYMYLLGKLYFSLFWLAALITTLFILCSRPLIELLYGSEYTGSAVILAIHSMASIAVFLGVGSAQYLLTENMQKISLYRTAAGATINILLNLILIPKYGAGGAAIGTTISYYISLLSIFVFRTSRPHAKHILKAPFLFGKYLNFRILP